MSGDRHLFRSSVFVMLFDDADRVLLQRRANTGFMDGSYDFVSGHVEDGESIRQTAVREVGEESGVVVGEDDLELVHINQNHLEVPYISFIFAAKQWVGEPTIREPDKCDRSEFMALADIPDNVSLSVRLATLYYSPGRLTYSYTDKTAFRELFGRDF